MSVDEFLAGYAADFASHDAAAVVEHFVYPVHAVGDTDAGPEVITAGREEWQQILERVLDAYRRLEVASADVDGLRLSRLGRGVHVACVGWTLRRADKTSVYRFEASYTLVSADGRCRITAIAHDEGPKLRAALADRRRRQQSAGR